MNSISCDVCMDLIPLVKDSVASQDSHLLVQDHIAECEHCRSVYDTFQGQGSVMNERYVVSKIKKQLFFVAIGVVVLGAMLGIGLSNSMGMFYNILIMPAIGGIGYFAFREKAYFVPLYLFMFSYIWVFIRYCSEGMFESGFRIAALVAPVYLSVLYAGFCGLGVLISALLGFAFKREKKR